MNKVVRLNEVAVRYPNGVVGLESTTLDLQNDQITVLLGQSGAGKSTLLRTLNGLVRPTNGSIEIDGLGKLDDPVLMRRHRRQTAMIFQQHQLIARGTALSNVLLARLAHHGTLRSLLPWPTTDRMLGLRCLERVGLLDKALERCDALSGGQQQRVGIARALAQEPKLILADEPVASLDPASAQRVLGMLRDICRNSSIPAVVSLHQLDLAMAFADRVIGLKAGRVQFDGKPAELTSNDFTRLYGQTVEATSRATHMYEEAS